MVTGFLFAEHIIHQPSDIISIRFSGHSDEPSLQENSVLVELSPDVRVELSEQKNFLTHSACGFCGRNAFDGDSKEGIFAPLSDHLRILTSTLFQLPAQLQAEQSLFAETGGSHAVALFDLQGQLLTMAEDVGRHNAMDKLLGVMFREKKIPLSNHVVLFSGRLSYELVQKSLAGGIPVVASIGAPTSLAVELATDYNITVIGFLKEDKMNVYCGNERIAQG
jgi:FdhD protein